MNRPRGGLIGVTSTPTAGLSGVASGMWSLNEVYNWRRAGQWPSSYINPTSISGCNLWLDFSDTSSITLVGGNISQINDKSGNNFHATQSTAADRPGQTTQNGLNCGNWGTTTNSKSLKYSPGGTSNNWREIAIVGVWIGSNGFTDYSGLFTGSTDVGTASGVGLVGDGNNGETWYGIGSASWCSAVILNGTVTSTAFPAIKTPFVIQAYRTSDIGVNGYAVGFDRINSDRGWLGSICEVVAYNRELTTQERLILRNNLKQKWATA